MDHTLKYEEFVKKKPHRKRDQTCGHQEAGGQGLKATGERQSKDTKFQLQGK